MTAIRFTTFLPLALLVLFQSAAAPSGSELQLLWIDEFNGSSNAKPDPAKWKYDLGTNNGWGNRELETYTNETENAHLDGQGHLVIHVSRTPDGFTSARLKTKGLFAVKYGRIEARIKVPFGQGIWPAFWLLGTDIDSKGWPLCGELDVIEMIGKEPSINHAKVHGPGYSGRNGVTTTYRLEGGQKFSDDFHTFSLEWAPKTITFAVDGNPYQTLTPASLPPGSTWVFDKPFFLLLNVAVGGDFPGNPDSTTSFPQQMLVDYVRVYKLPRTKIRPIDRD